MRKLFFILLILPALSYSQSPYFSIKFRIIDNSAGIRPFKTHVDMCKFNYSPKVPSGDYWFGTDTSAIDFNNIPDSLMSKMECKNFFDQNGDSVSNGNQIMAWEHIFKIQILRTDNAVDADTMTIVFPVKIKAFVTFADLGKITFKKGYYELTDAMEYKVTESKNLSMTIKKDYDWKESEKRIKLKP